MYLCWHGGWVRKSTIIWWRNRDGSLQVYNFQEVSFFKTEMTQWFQSLLSNPHFSSNSYYLSKYLKCLCTLYFKQLEIRDQFYMKSFLIKCGSKRDWKLSTWRLWRILFYLYLFFSLSLQIPRNDVFFKYVQSFHEDDEKRLKVWTAAFRTKRKLSEKTQNLLESARVVIWKMTVCKM